MGNPHAVMLVPDVDAAPVTTLGPRIEQHERFPNRVNAGFMEIRDPTHVRLRVWERGAGETLACGSGACAAVVAGRRLGRLGDTVAVAARGGMLSVAWAGEGEPVWLTGPATTVFEGTIEL
jgi:diaminopimelate epimerase